MNIFEKLFGDISAKFNFLNRHNSPSNKATLRESAGNVVQQAGRDFHIGTEHGEDISDLERKILHKLYLVYKETGRYPRLDLQATHREIGISDGDYIGPVNGSKFLQVDGNDYVLKDAGIRFMDSYVRSNKPEVDVIGLAISGGPRGQEITGLRLVNNGNAVAIDVRCFIESDEMERVNFANIDRMQSNEDTKCSLGYRYSDTVLSTKLLKNLRLIIEYKNKDGFCFSLGRLLGQEKRADGNYNISRQLRDYFEG